MATNPHLEFIVGPMFSGKTTTFNLRLNLYEVAGLKVQSFKSIIENRYGKNHTVSHDKLSRSSIDVDGVDKIIEKLDYSADCYGIDEIQFFESRIVDWCDEQTNNGKIVVVSGLLTDFRNQYFPFIDGKGNTSDFFRIADRITPLTALCTYVNYAGGKRCGEEATRTQRIEEKEIASQESDTVDVGTDQYQARCRQHFQFYE